MLFRIGFAGFRTKIWPAIVMVDSGGGAEMDDGVPCVTDKKLIARLAKRIKNAIFITRK